MKSILTDGEVEKLDGIIKGLGATGVYRPSKRAEATAEIEGIVREACARMMDDLSSHDPLQGPVWGMCLIGAKHIRGERDYDITASKNG